MDNQDKDKNPELTPEEQKAEEEIEKGSQASEDEIREKLADEMGIDPDDDSELLDKLVAREKAHREKLYGAIKQKRSWREKAQGVSGKPKDNPEENKGSKQDKPEDPYEVARRVVREEFENKDLESLSLPDSLKTEVKDLAKLKGISIREAAQLPYIQSRKEAIEREERINNASPKRSNKGSLAVNYDPSKPLNPDDFSLDTEEGQKAWKEAKAAREKYNAQKN